MSANANLLQHTPRVLMSPICSILPRFLRGSRLTHLLLGAASLVVIPVLAAQVEEAEYAALTSLAQRDGAAHVVVTVAQLSLIDADGADPTKLALLRASERALFHELGVQIWPFGQWNNQLGQLGLYATPAALQTLRATRHAVSFRGGVHATLGGHRTSPEFRTLEAKLSLGGNVDALVRIRNEAAGFDITPIGTLEVSGGMVAVKEHQTRAARVLATLRSEDVPNLAQAQAALKAAAGRPTLATLDLNLRINYRALSTLATHSDVGSLSWAHQPPAPDPILDERALDFARADGYAHVLLLLRDPTRQALLTPREAERALAAKQRALRAYWPLPA